MTLTEIEDQIIEDAVRSIDVMAQNPRVDVETTFRNYLTFLQATEIRRRLVDDAEKKASLKSYEISFAAPVTVPEEITFT